MKILGLFVLMGLTLPSSLQVVKPPVPLNPQTMIITITPDREGCWVNNDVYFWFGADGMMGWDVTCELAHRDWMKNVPPYIARTWKI